MRSHYCELYDNFDQTSRCYSKWFLSCSVFVVPVRFKTASFTFHLMTRARSKLMKLRQGAVMRQTCCTAQGRWNLVIKCWSTFPIKWRIVSCKISMAFKSINSSIRLTLIIVSLKWNLLIAWFYSLSIGFINAVSKYVSICLVKMSKLWSETYFSYNFI